MAAKTATRMKATKAEPDTGLCCASVNDSLSVADAEALAQRFAALGDPVRLRLFSMIASSGEVCSCNMTEPLGKSQPTVSHHTKILSEAGLIVGEKRGRWVWWRAVPGAAEAMQAAVDRLQIHAP